MKFALSIIVPLLLLGYGVPNVKTGFIVSASSAMVITMYRHIHLTVTMPAVMVMKENG